MSLTTLALIFLVPFLVWRIYQRLKSQMARQRSIMSRHYTGLLVFGGMLLVPAAELGDRPLSLAALAAGAIAGIGLSTYGLRRTRFEDTSEGYFFTPPMRMGILVGMLLVARVIYLGIEIYMNQGSSQPNPRFSDSPATMFCLGMTAAYFATFSASLMRWRQRLRKEEIRRPSMTLNRRSFLGAVPIASLGLAAGGSAYAQYGGAPAANAASASTRHADMDTLVVLAGDALPRSMAAEPARLQALLDRHAKAGDSYLAGGAVAELEAKFSTLLGKEDTVFMPTGTLANHIALRLLCGDNRHALVQQESHVYRDESDTVTTLSGINLVPLAAGKAAPTLEELSAAIERAEVGPYPIKVGAIALESPVRRAQGACLSPALVARSRRSRARKRSRCTWTAPACCS
jgi:uncharacterized membrane protein YfcA